MAQLFTIYFPKYYFDLQKEFSIEIDKLELPFEYVVEDGRCYVTVVHYDQDNEGDPHFWHKKGLQPGLRVIAINNISLIDQYNNEDDDGNINPDNILTRDITETLLAEAETEKFTVEFREEVSLEDHSAALGLGYDEDEKKEDVIANNTKMEQDKSNNLQISVSPTSHSKAPSTSIKDKLSTIRSLFERIEDSQIGASSFEQDYEPSQCRLNNPFSFWQPSGDDQTTLDTWLRIDLGMKKMVTKLHLQGSPDHNSYVKSFWIDYSDDCCQWKSHPLGEIKCKYKNHTRNQSLHSSIKALHLLSNEQDTKDIYAEIIVWPAITARFIRIRPYTVENKVAVRLEIYGFKEIVTEANISFARVVTMNDLNGTDKNKLMARVADLPPNTRVIQVDCKAVISAALDRAGLTSVGFLKADDDNFICVFTTSGADASERALNELAEVGVGREMGVISTTAVAFRNEPTNKENEALVKKKQKKRESTFSDSVKSRMIVKQVVERIMNSSAFTFDYICMLVVASLIAAGGLATDNAVIVVASMLVSPLMGPVLAFTFGVTLKEANMAKLGFKNEILSLVICVVSGFIVGIFYSLLSKNSNNWPTDQMASRGTVEGLADGAFIAAASGVGVALSVLGDYLSTVVGVAISASLLPPAVNCGMLFAFPIIAILYPQYIPHNKRYRNKKQLLSMAGWSLLLTIENIIIIFAVSRLMFYVKNVYITKDHHEKVWKSVTNFRQNYNKLASMRAESMRPAYDAVKRQSDMMNDSRTNIIHQQVVSTPNGTLTDKMRQSVRFAMDYDFETNSGTIKGGVLALTRQRSILKKESFTMEVNTPISTKNIQIGLMVPEDNTNRISASSSKSRGARQSKTNKVIDNDSSDSDQSDVDEDSKDKKKHRAVTDLFTPDKVASMKTPLHQQGSSNFDYDKIMDDAVQLAVINQDQEVLDGQKTDNVGVIATQSSETLHSHSPDSKSPLVSNEEDVQQNNNDNNNNKNNDDDNNNTAKNDNLYDSTKL